MTTNELAKKLGLQPHTLRVALCRGGHYFGVKPERSRNGRLVWPENAFELLLEGDPKRARQ